MADPTKPAGGEARPDFETLWQRAEAQPEIVHVDAPKIDIDTSPTGILNRLREVAEAAQAQGQLSAADHQSILTGTSEVERAFAAIAPDALVRQLGALRANVLGSKGKPK